MQSQTIQASVCQTMAALQAGQWQGSAANACFQEFDHVVKPAFQRLLHSLQGSVETTKAIRKIMADADILMENPELQGKLVYSFHPKSAVMYPPQSQFLAADPAITEAVKQHLREIGKLVE